MTDGGGRSAVANPGASDTSVQAWHGLAVPAVLDAFQTTTDGLSHTEAGRRLAQYGHNLLPEPPRRGPLRRFLDQFTSVLVLVLIAAAVITLAMGEADDAAVILAVIIINGIFGFVQEGKAERALAAIAAMLAPSASVLRDGSRVALPAADLVPGDIVLLDPGDLVPADLRLIAARGLTVAEAALTGEALPVEKDARPVTSAAILPERSSCAYMGTVVASGTGSGVVIATGGRTEIGRVGRLVASVVPPPTPLQRQIDEFSKQLSAAIVLVALGVFTIGWLAWQKPAIDMFLAAVSIAVAAIPEGLPAIVTIAMAVGVARMARRRAIIRRMPAVETLGAVSVICTDKTGTLTFNRMTVSDLVTPEGGWRSGERDGAKISPTAQPSLLRLLAATALCNDAALAQDVAGDGAPQGAGDPLEVALLAAAQQAGICLDRLRRRRPRQDTIPFDSDRRIMATVHALSTELNEGAADTLEPGTLLILKGAPEAVLAHAKVNEEERTRWLAEADAVARLGRRAILVATAPCETTPGDSTPGNAAAGHAEAALQCALPQILGLVAFADPPRPAAIAAVAECQAAGIRVKMITGDHTATASAIAAEVGIARPEPAISGTELAATDDVALKARAADHDVFARATPADKLRLVGALQADGAIIAMTGDGVNDAPALRRADVGVAMGRGGTEAARQAAAMVLADDDFATIVAAVREGRVVFDNLSKALAYVLPTSMGQAGVIVAAVLLGIVLPITPIQILWVNMVTAISLSIALALEPAEPGVMRRPPRRPDAPILGPMLLRRTVLVTLVMTAGGLILFQLAHDAGRTLEEARSLAVNGIVMIEVFLLLSARRLTQSCFVGDAHREGPYVPIAIAAVLLLQLAFTYAPPAQALFGTASLTAVDWFAIALAGSVAMIVTEADKALVRRGWLAGPDHAAKPKNRPQGERT